MIVHDLVRWWRRKRRVGRHDAAGAKGTHVQPGGCRAGPAVIDEGDGPLARVLGIGAGVRRVIKGTDRLVLLVLEQHRGRGGAVGDKLTPDPNRVIRGR